MRAAPNSSHHGRVDGSQCPPCSAPCRALAARGPLRRSHPPSSPSHTPCHAGTRRSRDRAGLMYVLDRVTGEFLNGRAYVKVNWADGFDSKGRPQRVPGMVPTKAGTVIRPHVHGATNWAPPSFSPRTGWFYVAHFENSSTVAVEGEFPRANGINPRQTTMGQINLQNFLNNEDEAYGVVRAYDPNTLEPKCEYKMADITWGGVLTTAGDVVFSGGNCHVLLA